MVGLLAESYETINHFDITRVVISQKRRGACEHGTSI